MRLQIRPASEADIPRMAEVIFTAFTNDSLHMAMFPRENESSYMDWYHARLLSSLENPRVQTMLVVDDSGANTEETIIAYGRWQCPASCTSSTQSEGAPTRSPIPFPAHANKNLVNSYVSLTDQMRQRYVDDDHDFVLQMLATDLKYQGRGAAKALLQMLVDLSEQRGRSESVTGRGLKIFLEATPGAVDLYTKLGWEAVDSIVMRLDDFGLHGGGTHCTTVMKRGSTL